MTVIAIYLQSHDTPINTRYIIEKELLNEKETVHLIQTFAVKNLLFRSNRFLNKN